MVPGDSLAYQLQMPSGDVTLMFTDIEGSTRAWETHKDRFRVVLQRHDVLLRAAIAQYSGFEVKTLGDSFMVAFHAPQDGLRCALAMQHALENETFDEVGQVRIRVGLHTADIEPIGRDYFGPPVNRAARIESAAHGGQILLSEETYRRLRDDLPDGIELRDEGLHQLKDLGDPQALYLVHDPTLPQRPYPPLRTMDVQPHNFPAQTTSFIGRDRELSDIKALLASRKTRLITLTGPGGTGKTRLAMQVAADAVQHYPQGVWLVELADVASANDVPAAIALALNISLTGDGNARQQVIAHLREHASLLVLDNFEQVVDAARFVSDLMKQCPRLALLVTSRHVLHISGEQEYVLEPLELPPSNVKMEKGLRYASMQLFVERCQSARAGFTLSDENIGTVADICRQLEGLPLAVELTATLMRGMTPQQLLPRLETRLRIINSTRRDLGPRQRSMRGSIDCSYELLTEDERLFYAELSVFVGGFSLDAAECICQTPGAFTMVYSLRDQSLLRVNEINGEDRYFMMETLREYAREKIELLDKQGEYNLNELRQRHSTYYCELAQTLSEQVEGAGDAALAMKRMMAEVDNMRVGMDWAVQEEGCDDVALYGFALARFLLVRGLYAEGDQRLAIAEQSCRSSGAKASLARLLTQRGRIAYQRSEFEKARPLYQESYEIGKELGDNARLVAVLINMGNMAWGEDDYDRAQALWEEGLVLAVQTGQPKYEAILNSSLGMLAGGRGDAEAATRYFNQAIAINRRQNNQSAMAYTLMHMGELLLRQGDYEAAREHFSQSHALFVEIGRRQETALTLGHLAETALAQNDPTLWHEAAEHIEAALEIAEEIKDPWTEMYCLGYKGDLLGKRGDLKGAFHCYRRSWSLALKHGGRAQIAYLLRYAGHTLRDHEQTDKAHRALLAARDIFADLKLPDVGILEGELNAMGYAPPPDAKSSSPEEAQTLLDTF